ncbi:retrovirus-related pol polyprotein from transposon TNT 1-94 [Tanacetum coccineum]
MKCVTMPNPMKPKVLAPSMYAIDFEPIPPRNRNNREVYLEYLKHLKESVGTLREIVEEARELLEYVIGTYPKDFNKRYRKIAIVPLNRKKRVTFMEPGVKDATASSGSKPRSNTKKDRTLLAKNDMKKVIHIVLSYFDSGCSKHITGDHSQLRNFVKKFIGTDRFENDHFGAIMGYGYYVIGDSVISRVYYVEGLGHNLFSVGQFCDSDLEVAFRKHSCYVRDVNGVDLIKGNCVTNLYNISIEDIMKSSPICLLSKASKNKSWLWHHRLNHLNFGTINDLTQKDLVRGLPRLKFEKDHLCSACQLGRSQKYSHKPKSENTNMKVLNTLHMDLCGPMRVQTINRKKYILVIIDDYSRFTWVKFLILKDETPEFVIKFLKQIQVGLNKTARYIHTDNGTEFVNQFLIEYYESVGIFTKNQAEAVATACYTKNQSLIHTRHNKTPYELVHDKKPDLKFLCVFSALCYPINDSEDLGKLRPTTDIGIFVQFDELTEPIALVHISTRPEPILLTPGQISSGLVPDPVPAAPYVPPTNKDLDILFQLMFDEYFESPCVKRQAPPAPVVQVPVVSAGTPSSTTIDQDLSSTSYSPSSSVIQPPISHEGVAVGPTTEDNPLTQADNDPFVNMFAPEPSSDESSSGDVSLAESTQVVHPYNHLGKWSKDHLLDNVIGNPSHPVSTRKQLATDALWCLYNSVLSKVKPKNVKTAMDEVCWFEAM